MFKIKVLLVQGLLLVFSVEGDSRLLPPHTHPGNRLQMKRAIFVLAIKVRFSF